MKREKEKLVAAQESESLMKNLLLKIDEFNEAKQKLMEEVQTQFAIVVGSLMRKSAHLNTYSIQAYTPYFNDGDTCEYSVNTWGEVNEDEEGDENRGDGWGSEDDAIVQEIRKFLSIIDKEIFKGVYGDHVKIVFHRDGTSVTSEYEHE